MAKSYPGAGKSASPTRVAMGGASSASGNSQQFAPRKIGQGTETPRSKPSAAAGNSRHGAPGQVANSTSMGMSARGTGKGGTC